MNKDEYKKILEAAESELVVLIEDFEQLENKLETRKTEILEVENTISFIKKKLHSENKSEEFDLDENYPPMYYENKENSPQQKAWTKIIQWENIKSNEDFENSKETHVPLWEATEAFLQALDKPLHIDEILERLKSVKHDPKKDSLAGILHQKSEVFVNLGRNKWDLKSRH